MSEKIDHLATLAAVLEAARVPWKFVAWDCCVSNSTVRAWRRDGAPERYLARLNELEEFIRRETEKGTLPMSMDYLAWLGLQRIWYHPEDFN